MTRAERSSGRHGRRVVRQPRQGEELVKAVTDIYRRLNLSERCDLLIQDYYNEAVDAISESSYFRCRPPMVCGSGYKTESQKFLIISNQTDFTLVIFPLTSVFL